jgi:hypothetical protein
LIGERRLQFRAAAFELHFKRCLKLAREVDPRLGQLEIAA